MKVKFLKHKISLLYVVIICSIASIISICVGFIQFPKLLFICFVGVALLVFLFYDIFINRNISSSVIFSEVGIEWKSFKKTVVSIRWDEITEIVDTIRGRGFRWLTFIAKDKRIDVELTQKMYNVIMILCPYQNLKRRIDDMECFKWFHRKKKDKNSNDF